MFERNRFPITFFLLAIAASWTYSSVAADLQEKLPKPNIVWIMSEDNSVHYLDHFYPGGADTPAIKDLAADGVTFRNAYSCAPVCSVARTTLITACYAPRLGTQYHRRSQQVKLPDDLKMFPAYLRTAGYFTSNNSKEDYNASGDKAAWDQSSRKASWRNRPTPDTPFFHVQTFTDSHESSLHFNQQVFNNEKTSHNPDSVTPHPYLPNTKLTKYTHARYLDRIQQIDKRVAEVTKQLKEDGVWEQTIVFYFGDHGGVLPRSKGYAYDTGLHVPLVIRIPKQYRDAWDVDAASSDDRFIEFVDFGPTVLSMAGAQIPDSVDGLPFLGYQVASADNFTSALGYADRFDEKYDFVRSLHKGKFHYIRNYQPFYPDGLFNEYRYKMLAYSEWKEMYDAGQLSDVQASFFRARPTEMLFDVDADPFEINNLATDPAYAQTLSELRNELSSRLKQLPDLSFLTEPICVPNAAVAPVAYAQSQQQQIGNLIDIADSCLAYTEQDQKRLAAAIDSDNPLQRFWAATALASFADGKHKLSGQLYDQAKQLLKDDDPMVRARAAEAYLVLSGVDPMENLLQCLSSSRSELETLWILNAIVFANDTYPSETPLDPTALKPPFQGGEIGRRIKYLTNH